MRPSRLAAWRRSERTASMDWQLLFQLSLNGLIVGALYGVVAM